VFETIRATGKVDGTDDGIAIVCSGLEVVTGRGIVRRGDLMRKLLAVGLKADVCDEMKQLVVLLDMRGPLRTLQQDVCGWGVPTSAERLAKCVDVLVRTKSYLDAWMRPREKRAFFERYLNEGGTSFVGILMETGLELLEFFLPHVACKDVLLDTALEACGTCEVTRAILGVGVFYMVMDELEWRHSASTRAAQMTLEQVGRRVSLVRDMLVWAAPRARYALHGRLWQFLADYLGYDAWVDIDGTMTSVGERAVATSTYAYIVAHADSLSKYWSRSAHAARALTHYQDVSAESGTWAVLDVGGMYIKSTTATNHLFATLM